MKKFLFISAAFVGMLFVTSCSNSDDPVPPTPVTKTYYEQMLEDYATVVANYPGMAGYMFEAQYELTTKVTEKDWKELKAKEVIYVFNDQKTKDVVYAKRNFENGLGLIYTFDHGQWQGDLPIDMSLQCISLEKALEQLFKSDIIKPATRFVTFRSPANGELFDKHPYYVFGGGSDVPVTVCVDAITGDVFDTPKSIDLGKVGGDQE
jgi:hypothetical protein